ncbi:tRNA (adenine(58)-N(1))-methyltransferase catalytic subunit trm61 [Lasiodiplodia theobromae]|uniref:tRNA (adenine(58)-N(1))-methyltransferase catalytic subunit TRM61 n=1 Tax=Lasiodiplodia theobromae TaxID=45133 RepID=A0A5N5DG82_9PEZI|nr:tRNA (adenine(58)-N(1))-methyltransferase catalytic subunit trm61 [Lasiodiplodia theobromae]
MPSFRPSPFLDPGAKTQDGQLALVHLSREHLTPVVINASPDAESEYAEGCVVNTRFGSFPHSTLVNVPWGMQVRAANVDTGRRGKKSNKKRKRDEDTPGDDDDSAAREVGFASTGFTHLIPPTPETWTISLPHRTQVVYTPDYSYVLQRLRVRPGDTLIEAGAGSGSFTHASVRATFNGYPLAEAEETAQVNGTENGKKKRKKFGHVYSFEYHEPRAIKLKEELKEHGMDQLVTVTHADVYKDGFSTTEDGTVPQADAIFLDLPAPWMALKHLARSRVAAATSTSTSPDTPEPTSEAPADFRSPLNPKKTVRICTFSPCIEQVQRTTSEMRRLGWTAIEMVEVLHRRIEVRRDRIGLHEEGLRGVNATPATVDEALGRLREVEGRIKNFHETMHGNAATAESSEQGGDSDLGKGWGKESKEQRLQRIREEEKRRKVFKEGRLVHRTEPEVKTHTSYLCFAVLPREWTKEDEEKARKKWENGGPTAKKDTTQKKQKGDKDAEE